MLTSDPMARSGKISYGLIPACIFFFFFPVVASGQVSIQAGMELFGRKHYEQAAGFFERNETAMKGDWQFQYYYGLSLYKTGNTKAAIRVLEKAEELSPDNSDICYALALANMAYAGEVNILRRVGIAKKMFRYLERSVTADPGNLPAHTFYAFFLANAPGFMGGDMDKARESANALYEVDKAAAAYVEAVIAAKEKREEDAVASYLKAIEYRGNYPGAEFALAGYLAGLDRTGEALTHYRAFTEMELAWYDPGLWQAYSAMGDIYGDRGEREQARTHYELALEHATNDKARETVRESLDDL